jgi:hypothetical protein
MGNNIGYELLKEYWGIGSNGRIWLKLTVYDKILVSFTQFLRFSLDKIQPKA